MTKSSVALFLSVFIFLISKNCLSSSIDSSLVLIVSPKAEILCPLEKTNPVDVQIQQYKVRFPKALYGYLSGYKKFDLRTRFDEKLKLREQISYENQKEYFRTILKQISYNPDAYLFASIDKTIGKVVLHAEIIDLSSKTLAVASRNIEFTKFLDDDAVQIKIQELAHSLVEKIYKSPHNSVKAVNQQADNSVQAKKQKLPSSYTNKNYKPTQANVKTVNQQADNSAQVKLKTATTKNYKSPQANVIKTNIQLGVEISPGWTSSNDWTNYNISSAIDWKLGLDEQGSYAFSLGLYAKYNPFHDDKIKPDTSRSGLSTEHIGGGFYDHTLEEIITTSSVKYTWELGLRGSKIIFNKLGSFLTIGVAELRSRESIEGSKTIWIEFDDQIIEGPVTISGALPESTSKIFCLSFGSGIEYNITKWLIIDSSFNFKKYENKKKDIRVAFGIKLNF